MKRTVLMLCLLGLALPALAQLRSFPAGAMAGQLLDSAYPNYLIGDRVYRAAPGLRIYDQSNRMVLPGSVRPTGPVLYQLDLQGNLLKLWILTPAEAARLTQ